MKMPVKNLREGKNPSPKKIKNAILKKKNKMNHNKVGNKTVAVPEKLKKEKKEKIVAILEKPNKEKKSKLVTVVEKPKAVNEQKNVLKKSKKEKKGKIETVVEQPETINNKKNALEKSKKEKKSKIEVELENPQIVNKQKSVLKKSKKEKKSKIETQLENPEIKNKENKVVVLKKSQKKINITNNVNVKNKIKIINPPNNNVKKSIEQKKTKGIKRQKEIKPKVNTNKVVKKEVKNKDEELIEKLSIPACGFNWDNKDDEVKKEDSSSSEDEDADNEPKKKKKKLSAAERREDERQKEREIRQREEALASNDFPNSVDQFDRLVLASPNSSLIWLQYMAHHLQATEIEKSRAVAKRALKTINFREEDEKLNVWQAWLNLESKFGSPESLEDVLKEAVRANDAKKIYLHMLIVHSEAKRLNELENTVKKVTGKFKTDSEVWIACGCAYLKSGATEKSRYIMQRALDSLPDNKHVDLIVKFAHLENKYGEKDRTKILFDKILTSYPKRIDVWTSYVDLLIKDKDFDSARSVLDRSVVQNLPARKMKTLFQKYITFEEKFGTLESLQHARQLVQDFVSKQCNKSTV